MANTVFHRTVVSEIAAFLHDVRYIILFYVFGDFLTTQQALKYGIEENVFLRMLMAEYGLWSLLASKVLFLVIVYCNYRSLRQEETKLALLWDISKTFIVSVGIFLVVNNLMVIFFECSIL
ncbi:MAG: hypothetical protein JW705_04100 [Methanosarcinaceae archaeon]|nr:hypothetical protein [Methanosarcinaceae archaeon]